MIKVFGHTSPDTDSTGSPIVWAWYLNEIRQNPAKPVLLGEPNTEAGWMLTRWNLDKPEILKPLQVICVQILQKIKIFFQRSFRLETARSDILADRRKFERSDLKE